MIFPHIGGLAHHFGNSSVSAMELGQLFVEQPCEKALI